MNMAKFTVWSCIITEHTQHSNFTSTWTWCFSWSSIIWSPKNDMFHKPCREIWSNRNPACATFVCWCVVRLFRSGLCIWQPICVTKGWSDTELNKTYFKIKLKKKCAKKIERISSERKPPQDQKLRSDGGKKKKPKKIEHTRDHSTRQIAINRCKSTSYWNGTGNGGMWTMRSAHTFLPVVKWTWSPCEWLGSGMRASHLLQRVLADY